MNLSRRVLITGSAQGLGREMALHLAAPGTLLLLHYGTSEAAAQSLVDAAGGLGARAVALQADLAEPRERERLMERVKAETDSLQVLINNAGLYLPTPLMEITAAQWGTTMEVTCGAVHHLIQMAAPLLRKGAPARVVNMGDSGNDRIVSRPQATPYHIAKLGVNVLTRSYARALGPDGITVNQISPGIMENSIDGPEAPIPAGRRGAYSDLLAAMDYLLSPAAEYVSGTNLVVSGGWNR